MNYRDALLQSGDDVQISLDVSPGSKKTVFPAGYNEWRNAIECRIKSPATEGKANAEIIKTIADYFSVKKSDVVIVSGAISGQKKIKISGVSLEDALERVLGDLGE
ncbi:DUF167 domain-containing protein [Methanolacinia petrolearia]|uniref:DUF167 domain-containing protein n=1 Tax=Methanolacinia petrolearia TaxID=54120 RepID=UPI003BADA471